MHLCPDDSSALCLVLHDASQLNASIHTHCAQLVGGESDIAFSKKLCMVYRTASPFAAPVIICHALLAGVLVLERAHLSAWLHRNPARSSRNGWKTPRAATVNVLHRILRSKVVGRMFRAPYSPSHSCKGSIWDTCSNARCTS